MKKLIDEIVREARWVKGRTAEPPQWLEKVVTNPGTGNKVKVKSLPPEVRKKYKPKDEEGGKEEKKPGWFQRMKDKMKKTVELGNLENKKDMLNEDLDDDDTGFEVYRGDTIMWKGNVLRDKENYVDIDDATKSKMKEEGVLEKFEQYKKNVGEVENKMKAVENS